MLNLMSMAVTARGDMGEVMHRPPFSTVKTKAAPTHKLNIPTMDDLFIIFLVLEPLSQSR